MNEIKIKVSIKRWIFIILATVAIFAVFMGISMAFGNTKDNAIWLSVFLLIVLAINFGRAFLTNNTRLVITDVSIRVNVQEPWIVQLSGVDSFDVDEYKGQKFIGVRYKDNVEGNFPEDLIIKGRKQRLKAALKGYPYEIYVDGLSMKPQEICDLLNGKLTENRPL